MELLALVTLAWLALFAIALGLFARHRLTEIDRHAEALADEFDGEASGARTYLMTTGWTAAALSAWCQALAVWLVFSHTG